MSVVFADTFYFLALLNEQDEDHAKAVEASELFSNEQQRLTGRFALPLHPCLSAFIGGSIKRRYATLTLPCQFGRSI